MKTIKYTQRNTAAGTIYLDLSQADQQYIIDEIQRQACFMNELGMCQDPAVKQALDWYSKGSKDFPYSSMWRRYNSPRSFISGLVNNIEYGAQRNFSLAQVEQLAVIMNFITELQLLVRSVNKLDPQPTTEPELVEFSQQLFV